MQGHQIVVGIYFHEATGMNDAHEHIPDIGPELAFIEQGILPIENRPLQRSFAKIVIQRGSWNAQEEGELLPVLEHVLNGFAQSGVWLNQFPVELFFKPGLEIVHHGTAVFLVIREPSFGRHVSHPGDLIIFVYLPNLLNDISALIGEAPGHVDESASRMGVAVGQYGCKLLGYISR